MATSKLSYKDAGVDVDANASWVQRIKTAMESTYSSHVWGQHGAFAGLYRIGNKPGGKTLVACADGVGTKIILHLKAGTLHSAGIDCVAMNVNDMICCGAEPMFFLDYLAVHKLDPEKLAGIVEGLADGCRQSGCALLGGETAEMPDLYKKGDVDVAGFAVGMVDEKRMVDPSKVSEGDVLIGLPSSGPHSNGYTLVRKLLQRSKIRLTDSHNSLPGTVGDAILAPTRIYVHPVLELLRQYPKTRVINGMGHITGGGLPENVARMLPAGCDALIDTKAWKAPAVFTFLQKLGVTRKEMFRVFNMGVGFVLAVKPRFARGVIQKLEKLDQPAFEIGHVARGSGKVKLK